jgi:hypothetical protein
MASTTSASELQCWEAQKIVPLQQKLAAFVQVLQNSLDVNNNGEFQAFIDPTIIGSCAMLYETADEIPNDKVNEATVPVEYVDNMPCIHGVPIWERLDGEKVQYYDIYKDYRDMKWFGGSQYATRSIANVAIKLGVSGRLIQILSKIYLWAPRVQAYDAQKLKELNLQKEAEREHLESRHLEFSNKILEQAVAYLSKHDAALNPKIAVSMVELGMKYGRISAGLLGDKPGTQSAAIHTQTNISLSQSSTQETEYMVNTGTGNIQNQRQAAKSGTERQLADDLKDDGAMSNIIYVLQKSGALQQGVESFAKEIVDEGDSTGDTDDSVGGSHLDVDATNAANIGVNALEGDHSA